MTTDITELVQRENFELWVEENHSLRWGYLKIRRTDDGFYTEDAYTSLWGAWKAASAELESRTVNVENLQESAYRAGLTAGWNLGLTNNNDGFNKCLAAHAAGIKWEAE